MSDAPATTLNRTALLNAASRLGELLASGERAAVLRTLAARLRDATTGTKHPEVAIAARLACDGADSLLQVHARVLEEVLLSALDTSHDDRLAVVLHPDPVAALDLLTLVSTEGLRAAVADDLDDLCVITEAWPPAGLLIASHSRGRMILRSWRQRRFDETTFAAFVDAFPADQVPGIDAGAQLCVVGAEHRSAAAMALVAHQARSPHEIDPGGCFGTIDDLSLALELAQSRARRARRSNSLAVVRPTTSTGGPSPRHELRHLTIALRRALPELSMIVPLDDGEIAGLLPGVGPGEAAARLEGALAPLRDKAQPDGTPRTLSASVVGVRPAWSLEIALERARARLDKGERGLTHAEALPDARFRGRVLVIEHDREVAAIMTRLLRILGMQLETYRGPQAALKALDSGDFDLAIVDLDLPDHDGAELLAVLRAHPHAEHLPVLALSDRGDDTTVAVAFRHRADDLLRKPFSPVELLARARRLVGLR